jgi:biotin transport system substrate-specific component
MASAPTPGTVLQRPATLGDLLPPRALSPTMRNALLVAGGAVVTAVAAQLAFTVPWTPVPYTLQTGAVLLVGTSLGAVRGSLSMVLYVLLGVAGLPVYSQASGGVAHLLGATGGYLVAFILAAALVGRLAQDGWDRTPMRAAALMVVGTLVIYAFGVPALAGAYPMELGTALQLGALVFLPWDVAKVAAAALLLPLAWRLAGTPRD